MMNILRSEASVNCRVSTTVQVSELKYSVILGEKYSHTVVRMQITVSARMENSVGRVARPREAMGYRLENNMPVILSYLYNKLLLFFKRKK